MQVNYTDEWKPWLMYSKEGSGRLSATESRWSREADAVLNRAPADNTDSDGFDSDVIQTAAVRNKLASILQDKSKYFIIRITSQYTDHILFNL